MHSELPDFVAWQAFLREHETGPIPIILLAFTVIFSLLIGRYSWPKVAGAIRNGLVLGWWLAFGLGLLWSLT